MATEIVSTSLPEQGMMVEQLEEAQRRERLQTAKLNHQLQRYRDLEARLEILSKKITEGQYDVTADLKHELEFERAQGRRLIERLDRLDESIDALTLENQSLVGRLTELEAENNELMKLLSVREDWLDQARAKLQAYQKEMEDSYLESRERRCRVTALNEDKKRLERCLEQAVKTREKAILENEYLKHELFDQRKKLLNTYIEFGKKPMPGEFEEDYEF